MARHLQADLIMQVAQIRAEGMCEHWEYCHKGFPANIWVSFGMDGPLGMDIESTNIRMKPSHPDYNTDKNPNRPKPVLKQIDMSKLPVGTMTNYGEIMYQSSVYALCWPLCSNEVYDCMHKKLRLAEQTKWTAWLGGECPVPQGCAGKVILRSGSILDVEPGLAWWHGKPIMGDIIAYRITGVADGYTDGSL
jgi:hypothetical protein